MVPFYGQGMNCGFEDILVLNEIIDSICGNGIPAKEKVQQILDQYSLQRNPDAEAMCDLAMQNYVEMRSDVTKISYIIRKKVFFLINNVD
jgi:kynurenine 3-monooxygenase